MSSRLKISGATHNVSRLSSIEHHLNRVPKWDFSSPSPQNDSPYKRQKTLNLSPSTSKQQQAQGVKKMRNSSALRRMAEKEIMLSREADVIGLKVKLE